MKRVVAFIALCILAVSCTNGSGARRVLEGAGYSNIEFTGYQFFSCGEEDTYHTGFTATGPTGIPVEGCVCEGLLFKNSTIRLK